MNKGIWIIIFLTIVVAILLVVAGLYYFNFVADQEIDFEKIPKSEPAEIELADEQIVRLEGQLTDPDPDTRFLAICSLNVAAQSDPEQIGPILLKALANQDPNVRFLAANQLGIIKYTPAAERLTALLDDQDKDVISGAAQALVKLDQEGLRAVMEGLAGNRLENVDRALIVARQITGESFGQGEEGRAKALEFWAEYKLLP